MRRQINIPRIPSLKRDLWQVEMLRHALLSGGTTYFVCASERQAKQAFDVATSLINGRGPGTQSG